MTRRERIALGYFMRMFERELRHLEKAPGRAAELTKGADEISRIAIQSGTFEATLRNGSNEMRRLFDQLRAEFPKIGWP